MAQMSKELETRKCIVTGNVLPKSELLRFVVLSNGQMLPDFNKKLGGKGVYLSNSKTLLTGLTLKKNPLNKILHQNVIIAPDLPQIVEGILAKKGLDGINLARKAGDLILGFEKVKDIIAKGKAAFVIEATDAGDDGKQKIATIAKDLEKFSLYDVATLSEALNRENTVYLVVAKGHMDGAIREAFRRYQTFLNE